MNKKLLALTTALTVAVSGAAFAKCDYEDCMKMMHRDMGGFVQSQADISTVKQAMEMPDDAIVTLKGNIEKQVKKDKYIFKDATGEMTVEIGNKPFIIRPLFVKKKDTRRKTSDIFFNLMKGKNHE